MCEWEEVSGGFWKHCVCLRSPLVQAESCDGEGSQQRAAERQSAKCAWGQSSPKGSQLSSWLRTGKLKKKYDLYSVRVFSFFLPFLLSVFKAKYILPKGHFVIPLFFGVQIIFSVMMVVCTF